MGKSNGKSKVEEAGLDVDHELPAGDGDESSTTVSASGSTSVGGTEAELQKLKTERDTLLDRLARAQAEFENARRRATTRQSTR